MYVLEVYPPTGLGHQWYTPQGECAIYTGDLQEAARFDTIRETYQFMREHERGLIPDLVEVEELHSRPPIIVLRRLV